MEINNNHKKEHNLKGNSELFFYYFDVWNPEAAVLLDPNIEEAVNEFIAIMHNSFALGETPCFCGINEERYESVLNTIEEEIERSERIFIINNAPLMIKLRDELLKRGFIAFFIDMNLKEYGNFYSNKTFNGYLS